MIPAAYVVVACGGDATAKVLASGPPGTNVPIGILPGVTGNVSSIEASIPLTLFEAAQVVVREDCSVRQKSLKC